MKSKILIITIVIIVIIAILWYFKKKTKNESSENENQETKTGKGISELNIKIGTSTEKIRKLTSYKEIKKVLENETSLIKGSLYDEGGYSNAGWGSRSEDDEGNWSAFYIHTLYTNKEYKVSESTYHKIVEEFKLCDMY